VGLFACGSIRSRKIEAALDGGRTIPSSRAETKTRRLMALGVVLCLATVGLIAASA
jgi:hypothetical protein